MDNGFDDVVGLVIIIAAVIGIVFVIWAAIMCVAVVGQIVGMGYAIGNFVLAVRSVSAERRSIWHYKSAEAKSDLGTTPPYKGAVFEEYAAKMYIMGPVFADIFSVIKTAIKLNFRHRMDFSDSDKGNWFLTAVVRIYIIGRGISIYVFGLLFSIAISLVIMIVSACCASLLFPVIGVFLLSESIYFKSKQINFRCASCKKEYSLPKYICPSCGIYHNWLKPGRFGIVHRKCLCGTILPLTVKTKGKVFSTDPLTGAIVTYPLMLSEIDCVCPFCGEENNAGLSHNISIALVGGASAGKTTFKVAFQQQFLTDEAIKQDLEVDFPDKESEDEYEMAGQYFSGRAVIPATNSGVKSDISTFSFILRNSAFQADRTVQIYDLPGERFESGTAREHWEHFSFTDGIVFLIDPFSIDKVRRDNSCDIKDSVMGICAADMNVLIESMQSTFDNLRLKKNKNGKFELPVALAISKVDSPLLKQQCGSKAVDRLVKGAPGVFKDRFAAMDYACRCFLDMNGGSNFIQTLDNSFQTVHFFSCSAVGSIPKTSFTRFAPQNVMSIMQWLMIRADRKNLGAVWHPEEQVDDLSDDQKQLYRTARNYYDDLVLKPILVT